VKRRDTLDVDKQVSGDPDIGSPSPWRRTTDGLVEVAARAYRGENSGILILAMLVIVVVFGIILREDSFLSLSNLASIIRVSTTITVMAVPTVYVISAGEIDLSIASVVAVSALISAELIQDKVPMILAVLAALAVGALIGLINGVVTVVFNIPSFVVTLGMMGALNGLAQVVTGTNTVSISDQLFLKIFGIGSVGGISVLIIWSAVALIIGGVVLTFTVTGRRVLATGANPRAARLSGISTRKIKIGAMVASGIGGALAGLLYNGQYAAASYTLGSSDLLTVIAAVIIGGTVLAGGKGSVVGAVVGSLLIGTLNNALVILGLGSPQQQMVQGLIIVLAVLFSARGGRGQSVFRLFHRPESAGGDQADQDGRKEVGALESGQPS
jgi:ribose transport system permease protein